MKLIVVLPFIVGLPLLPAALAFALTRKKTYALPVAFIVYLAAFITLIILLFEATKDVDMGM